VPGSVKVVANARWSLLLLSFRAFVFCDSPSLDQKLKITPAMAAGMSETVRYAERIVSLIDPHGRSQGAGPYQGKNRLRFQNETRILADLT
jgi:hypothetical protein